MLGRVFLGSTQFAHVSGRNIVNHIHKQVEKNYHGHPCYLHMQLCLKYGVLCPICLTVVEDKGEIIQGSIYNPNYHDFNNILPNCHFQCYELHKILDSVRSVRLYESRWEKSLKCLNGYKNKNILKWYFKWLTEQPKPILRFNPRIKLTP